MKTALLCCCFALAACRPSNDLVRVTSEIPRDIRYATTNNFTHQKLYDSADCYLRPDTARKLTEAAVDAQRLGYRL